MADCRDTLRELDAFLDDELAPDVRGHIHQHLDECVDCLSAFDFEAELKLAIRRKCSSDEMPPSLLDRLRQCFDPALAAEIERGTSAESADDGRNAPAD